MTARRTNWIGVTFGICLACFAAFQQFKLPPVLPVFLQRYDYDLTLAGGFMSVYALAGLLLSLLLGRAVERGGVGMPVLAGLILMAAGNGLTLLIPENGWIVLSARGLEGIGFAALAIGGPVLANTNVSARHLPLVIALTASWIPVGQLSATLLTPVALAWHGWRTLWVLAILGTAVLAAWMMKLKRSGAVDLSAGSGGGAPDRGAAIPPAQRLSLALAGAIFMLWSCQYFAYMTWLPQYLVEVHGLSVSMAVVGYTIPVAIVIAMILVTGMLLRAGLPLGPLLVCGLAAQAAGWWLIPPAVAGTAGIISLVVYGLAAGLCPTCLFAMPSAIAGHGRNAGSAFGIIMTGRNLGVFAGPILLAQALKMAGSWDIAVPILGTVTSLALVLGVCLAFRLAGAGYGTSR